MNDIVKLSIDCVKKSLVIEMSWIVLLIIIVTVLLFMRKRGIKGIEKAELVSVEVEFGTNGISNKAKYEIKKFDENIYIANRIYIELVTRKAALEINPDEDVIDDVYNSWYELFRIIRTEIKAIPAKYLKDETYTTNSLIELTMKILNEGLRPHLTKYQAGFRKWYLSAKDEKDVSPQEVQKQFPQFDELVGDLKRVNRVLYDYSEQLKKIIYNK